MFFCMASIMLLFLFICILDILSNNVVSDGLFLGNSVIDFSGNTFLELMSFSICWWYFFWSVWDKCSSARCQVVTIVFPFWIFLFCGRNLSQAFASISFASTFSLAIVTLFYGKVWIFITFPDIIIILEQILWRLRKCNFRMFSKLCSGWQNIELRYMRASVGLEKTVIEKASWFMVMKTSKKLMVLVDCDISNLMTNFIFLFHCIACKMLEVIQKWCLEQVHKEICIIRSNWGTHCYPFFEIKTIQKLNNIRFKN